MAIIKCKMCGGDLILEEGSNVAECEYCGSRQTVPSADNEKKLNLFARANRLRANNEFDKASGVYESIVADFPEEAEAYWGLILCKYGIEYVDDPATGKKIPTCHRSSFDSVMDDPNFELVMENADPIARRVYREEAKQLEELRKGIIEVSSHEEPYDIFICYKETDDRGDRTLDSVLAQDVYDMLTENGYRAFFSRVTLEDKLGVEYEPYIFAALNSAKIMLAFGTDYDNYNAVWVKNEWSRFLQLIAKGEKKTLIPCYKNIDAYDMPKEFAKLQAQDLGKVGAMQDLLRGIKKILPKQPSGEDSPVLQHAAAGPSVDSLLRRGQLYLEQGDWKSANEYFDKVLDIAPENAAAYIGKLCAERKQPSLEALGKAFRAEAVARDLDGDSVPEQVELYGVLVKRTPELDKLIRKDESLKAIGRIQNQYHLTLHQAKEAYDLLTGAKKPVGQPPVFREVSVDRSREEALIRELTVPGYLTTDMLRELFRFDLRCADPVQGAQKQLKTVEQALANNQNLSYARRFADGDTARQLQEFENEVLTHYRNRLQACEKTFHESCSARQAQYAAYIAEMEQEARQQHENALAARDADYHRAAERMEVGDYLHAADLLQTVGSYLDAPERLAFCVSENEKRYRAQQEAMARARNAAERERQRGLLQEELTKSRAALSQIDTQLKAAQKYKSRIPLHHVFHFLLMAVGIIAMSVENSSYPELLFPGMSPFTAKMIFFALGAGCFIGFFLFLIYRSKANAKIGRLLGVHTIVDRKMLAAQIEKLEQDKLKLQNSAIPDWERRLAALQ